MKAKAMQPQSQSRSAENEIVRVEIRAFLAALGSYPDGFAANPGLTFEEHRAKLTALARAAPVPNGSSENHQNKPREH